MGKKKTGMTMWLLGTVLALPLLLLFSEGEDGGPTVWNLVGLAYAGCWIAWAYLRAGKLADEERAFHEGLKNR